MPHVGWNNVEVKNESVLYSEMPLSPTFYFVHSYALIPEDENVVSGYCCHSEKFVASIEYKNIMATQFHPEKSQKDGLQLLLNWCRIVDRC